MKNGAPSPSPPPQRRRRKPPYSPPSPSPTSFTAAFANAANRKNSCANKPNAASPSSNAPSNKPLSAERLPAATLPAAAARIPVFGQACPVDLATDRAVLVPPEAGSRIPLLWLVLRAPDSPSLQVGSSGTLF